MSKPSVCDLCGATWSGNVHHCDTRDRRFVAPKTLSALEKDILRHRRGELEDAVGHGGLYSDPLRFRSAMLDAGVNRLPPRHIRSAADEARWDDIAREVIDQIANASLPQLYVYDAEFEGAEIRRHALKATKRSK